VSARQPRVVFDCMIFLQAAARGSSPSGACLTLAEQGLFELYVSPPILAEIEDVIRRPQIRAKFHQLTDQVVEEFIARIERIAVRVDEVGTPSLYLATRKTNRTSIWPPNVKPTTSSLVTATFSMVPTPL
jgi:predicted nucleic acid-binding protein